MMRRVLLPLVLLLLVAVPAWAGGKTRIYKGRVTVKSSATVPGVLPASRTSTMTIHLTRTGKKVQMKVIDPDGLGSGREYTSDDVGCITGACPADGVDDGTFDVEFDGPDFKRSVEARLARGMDSNPLARGMKIELDGARTTAKATLTPTHLKLDSRASISRKPFGGLRGRLAEGLVPRQIHLELSGELERQPD